MINIYNIFPTLLDVQSGLTQAKDLVMTNVKFLVNSIAVPIISTILAGVLIFAIVGAVKLKRQGEDYSNRITAIIVVILVIVLISTAPLWVWNVVGV